MRFQQQVCAPDSPIAIRKLLDLPNSRLVRSSPVPPIPIVPVGPIGKLSRNDCFPAQQTKSTWLSSCILSSWKLFNKQVKPVGIDLFDFSCYHSSYIEKKVSYTSICSCFYNPYGSSTLTWGRNFKQQ